MEYPFLSFKGRGYTASGGHATGDFAILHELLRELAFASVGNFRPRKRRESAKRLLAAVEDHVFMVPGTCRCKARHVCILPP